MSQMMVVFQSPEEILDFVNKVNRYPYDMDLKRGRFVVDAKSVVGIMNLGIKNPIAFKIYSEQCDETLMMDIKQYLAA